MKGRRDGSGKGGRLLWAAVVAVFLLAVLAALHFGGGSAGFSRAVLTVETPAKMSASENEEFVLDVSLSGMGDALYPAASLSISFDSARLEFLGVLEGNVFVHAGDSSGQQDYMLPAWNCNVEKSNETGQINVMYLDLTGGRQAFDRELLGQDDNVVMRLAFRLRGSVRSGDVLDLVVEDSVFAASDESESLSQTTGTLKAINGRIVIGE